mmetsp:Transcript_6488/g.19236  ORF Transcript_6488/g.19236 Transcript_6488/m.19236 type:complete len:358 (+) Transcript_6488:49-1122(+)
MMTPALTRPSAKHEMFETMRQTCKQQHKTQPVPTLRGQTALAVNHQTNCSRNSTAAGACICRCGPSRLNEDTTGFHQGGLGLFAARACICHCASRRADKNAGWFHCDLAFAPTTAHGAIEPCVSSRVLSWPRERVPAQRRVGPSPSGPLVGLRHPGSPAHEPAFNARLVDAVGTFTRQLYDVPAWPDLAHQADRALLVSAESPHGNVHRRARRCIAADTTMGNARIGELWARVVLEHTARGFFAKRRRHRRRGCGLFCGRTSRGALRHCRSLLGHGQIGEGHCRVRVNCKHLHRRPVCDLAPSGRRKHHQLGGIRRVLVVLVNVESIPLGWRSVATELEGPAAEHGDVKARVAIASK